MPLKAVLKEYAKSRALTRLTRPSHLAPRTQIFHAPHAPHAPKNIHAPHAPKFFTRPNFSRAQIFHAPKFFTRPNFSRAQITKAF